jgi:hypothetical protein
VCLWASGRRSSNKPRAFLVGCKFRAGLLRRGDVQIMDSRLLHCASANTSAATRRALLYISFQNPLCVELAAGVTDVAPGSRLEGLELTLGNFSGTNFR